MSGGGGGVGKCVVKNFRTVVTIAEVLFDIGVAVGCVRGRDDGCAYWSLACCLVCKKKQPNYELNEIRK